MQVFRSPSEVREEVRALRAQGNTIGLVPTMGGLHAGHLSLLRDGRARCDTLVMSLFVNPTQFGPNEDLDKYPRDEEGDLAAAEECGVDIVFCPAPENMYPEGFQTAICLSKLAAPMCGAGRPGHFAGVATVVTKLFHATLPDVAIFGQKDAQQLAIIKQLVSDLDFGIEIIAHAIVREDDGLAMSSRNAYLSKDARKQAACLFRGLNAATQRYEEGATDATTLLGAARAVIGAQPLATIEYLDLRDAATLEPIDEVRGPSLLALAAVFGQTRLIDNVVLGD
jgi:pantoate--beta-alanine ligase